MNKFISKRPRTYDIFLVFGRGGSLQLSKSAQRSCTLLPDPVICALLHK